jgi:hypothetical protein
LQDDAAIGGEENRVVTILIAVLPDQLDAEFQAHGVIPFDLYATLCLAAALTTATD